MLVLSRTLLSQRARRFRELALSFRMVLSLLKLLSKETIFDSIATTSDTKSTESDESKGVALRPLFLRLNDATPQTMYEHDAITVETSSGITLACAERGDPNAPAVILLHGYSDSWRSLAPLLTELAPERRTIAVTLRGHGDSDKSDIRYRIRDFAADLPDVLDHYGIARAAVVGHSMGTMVAARLALSHPERIDALVLIGALATLKGNEAEEPLREAVEALTDPVDPGFVREFQQGTLARPVPPEFMDTIVAESLKMPTRVWRSALHAMLDEDLGPELHHIAAAHAAALGRPDELCDRDSQDRLATSIPRAQLSVLPGAGHAPHWEDPPGIAGNVVAFLNATQAET